MAAGDRHANSSPATLEVAPLKRGIDPRWDRSASAGGLVEQAIDMAQRHGLLRNVEKAAKRVQAFIKAIDLARDG